ncbi:hypothetical protein PRIPAC_95836 [Pristionchus pacificus]|uniref:Uncharacterized protein n=1 Tax=Pristionchus pacificus TaxID=54126 RepID=A0A2A6BJK8_PRIPA|nr:hypothetical protein PRIPAC_95836 [Pristionchus pacificus]|eukprot:PDM66104.1 hypothetical protein PRIPAC_45329 [Pristionchus pacificus]
MHTPPLTSSSGLYNPLPPLFHPFTSRHSTRLPHLASSPTFFDLDMANVENTQRSDREDATPPSSPRSTQSNSSLCSEISEGRFEIDKQIGIEANSTGMYTLVLWSDGSTQWLPISNMNYAKDKTNKAGLILFIAGMLFIDPEHQFPRQFEVYFGYLKIDIAGMRQEARDVKAYKPGKCSVRKVSGRRKKLTPDELKEQARKEKAIKDAKMFAEFWAKFEKENKEAFVIPGKYRSKKKANRGRRGQSRARTPAARTPTGRAAPHVSPSPSPTGLPHKRIMTKIAVAQRQGRSTKAATKSGTATKAETSTKAFSGAGKTTGTNKVAIGSSTASAAAASTSVKTKGGKGKPSTKVFNGTGRTTGTTTNGTTVTSAAQSKRGGKTGGTHTAASGKSTKKTGQKKGK